MEQAIMTVEALAATYKKTELEQFLDALGWPWNTALSLELDRLIHTIEVNHERA